MARSHGQGSLFTREGARGSSWYGQWRVDGKLVKRKLGAVRAQGQTEGLTARGAEAALRDAIANLTTAEISRLTSAKARTIPTILEVLDAYLSDQGDNLKAATTAHDYRRVGVNWFGPFFGERPVSEITADDVRDLRERMLTTRLQNHAQGDETLGLRPKSVRNHLTLLSTLLSYSARREWVTRNVAVDVPRPGDRDDDDAAPLRFLEVHEVVDLVAHAKPGAFQEVDAALFLTAALTGLRMGELRALRWSCVDQAQGVVRVERSFTRGVESSPKSRKRRSVPMAPQVAERLNALRLASAWDRDDDLVFAHPATGETLSYTPITDRYHWSLKAAGIDETFNFHLLRHTFGTLLARAGEPVTAIQHWMGHSDLKVTERYMHFAPRHDQAARIAAAFAVADPRAEVMPGHRSNVTEGHFGTV